MAQITGDTAAEVNVKAIELVMKRGAIRETRNEATRELLDVSMRITRPLSALNMGIDDRGLVMGIGYVEGLMLVGQCSVPEWLADRWSVFETWVDDGVLTGSYGVRAHGAVRHVVSELKRSPMTRRAVLTINNTHRDLAAPSSDVPCTLSLQFLLRDGELHMIATMRSNDLWLGLPYDMIMFVMLQAAIARELRVRVGRYVHHAGSAHVYRKHWELTDGLRPAKRIELQGGDVWAAETVGDIGAWCRRTLMNPQAATAGSPFESMVTEALR